MSIIVRLSFLALLMATSMAQALEDSCDVDATALSFGEYDYDNGSYSDASIDIDCPAGTAFTIKLLEGQGNFRHRRLHGTRGDKLKYNLYTGRDYTQIWGDGHRAGTVSVFGIGQDRWQSFPVYGQIPSRQKADPGSYYDQIIILVSF